MVRCAVFDFDGTLVDSNAVKRSAYRDIFAELGSTGPCVEAVLEDEPGGDRHQVIAQILQRLDAAGFLRVGAEIQRLTSLYAERYNSICEDHAAECHEIPGASAALQRLSRRYVLYVNSATPDEPLRRVIRRRGWEGHFRGTVGSSQTKVENLANILERERVGGGEVVVVGDDQRDFNSALQCGCWFVGVVTPSSQFTSPPVYSVDNLLELEPIMDRLNGVTS
jgi:phosphoglycolate phosphatase-like HAD superfamily hydrolase